MPKRTRSYKSWLSENLTDPVVAANYLNAAMKDSPEMFLVALRNVSSAHVGIAAIAEKANLSRESLYRSLSEKGNPEWSTLTGVLSAIGLEISIQPKVEPQNVPQPVQLQMSAAEAIQEECHASRGILSALTQRSRTGGQAASTQITNQELAYANY